MKEKEENKERKLRVEKVLAKLERKINQVKKVDLVRNTEERR